MEKSVLIEIAKELDLGKVLCSPTRVYGGFLHLSYKLTTDKGVFVVKEFGKTDNEKETIKSFSEREKLEEKLKKNKIPAVFPLKFNGRGVQVVNGNVFYIFPFIDAVSLSAEEMTKQQLEEVAKVEAKLHSIGIIKSEKEDLRQINIDWDYYLKVAKETKCPLYKNLAKILPVLKELTAKYNEYIAYIPKVLVVSHNDMDCKNILWNKDGLHLIDLECIGYNSPYYEAYKYALVYAGFEEGNIKKEKVEHFMKTYFENLEIELDRNISPEVLYYASGLNLEWLEFSLKRAMKLVGKTAEEQEVGFTQSELCFKEISNFYKCKDKLLNIKFN